MRPQTVRSLKVTMGIEVPEHAAVARVIRAQVSIE